MAVIFAIRGYYQARSHWESKYHEQLNLSFQEYRDACELVFRLEADLAFNDSTIKLLRETHGEDAKLDSYYSKKNQTRDNLTKAWKDMTSSTIRLYGSVQLLKNLKISSSIYLNGRYLSHAKQEITQAIQQLPMREQEYIAIGLESPFKLGERWCTLDEKFNVMKP